MIYPWEVCDCEHHQEMKIYFEKYIKKIQIKKN